MSLRPITTEEKLIWERQANKVMAQALKESETELGMANAEIEELKYRIKTSKDPEFKKIRKEDSAVLKNKVQRELEVKIRDLKKENEILFNRLAIANKKLKENENSKA